MKTIRILSDYTPANKPNILTIHQDDQGDIHLSMFESERHGGERGVRIAASGTRHSPRVREAFRQLIEAYQKELADAECDPHIKEQNE
jgi:hypothetical protein